MVVQKEMDLIQIQADELKVKTYLGTLWMGLVMSVKENEYVHANADGESDADADKYSAGWMHGRV